MLAGIENSETTAGIALTASAAAIAFPWQLMVLSIAVVTVAEQCEASISARKNTRIN